MPETGINNFKRILVPIVGKGSVVHVIRTGLLKNMSLFCTPVVVITWQDDALLNEMMMEGFEAYVLPEYKVNDDYKLVRAKMDYWYQRYKLKTPSTGIQQQLINAYRPGKKVLKNGLIKMRERIKATVWPGYAENNRQQEALLIQQQSAYIVFSEWLAERNIEGIFTVTPFLNEIELLARIIRERGGRVIASIHSFDNITKRGWPAFFFDHYFVWNIHNKLELQRISEDLHDSKITIAGAPQFDFHYHESYCYTKQEWQEMMGLPPSKKIILYAGGVKGLFPDEPQYPLHLKEAIERGGLGSDVVILMRNHPLDNVERWENFLGKSPFVFWDVNKGGAVKMDFSNVSLHEIKSFISTLKYTDVHVNLCSTMAVDGSVFAKPQVGPAYDAYDNKKGELIKKMYFQEHYRPIMKSGAVKLAHSPGQLVQLVKQALENPAEFTNHSQDCVKEIITYTDGQSARRVSDKLKMIFAE
ncbi:CDP-glycerol glycerophosphotransferase family protein [Foetidibacter luteolus]|uniref:CDP-glycerol glycerophosphotransferase family protein n=1 Tax=Foetidibacter luteolus TaxID=2608880 RepID=UPI00129ACF83|nr:CDP-glycerol glycerophosphotransferase family protein [Foetidibacter luteolus]